MTLHYHFPKKGSRLFFLFSLLVVIFIFSSCNNLQVTPKVYRVGVLSGLNYIANITDGFKAKMTELGYVERQNIIYDVQKTDFDMAAYKRILQKFVTDEVDLIVTFPTEASIEAKAAIRGTNIPMVFSFAMVEDTGLINSVSEPGGNITGVRYPGPDIVLKRFEIMCELVPQVKQILVPYQKGYPIVNAQLEALRPAAKAAGVTLVEIPATNAAELETELQARTKSADFDPDAVLIIIEPLGVTPDAFAVLGKFAAEHKNIPIGGAFTSVGEYNSVFAVTADAFKTGEQTAPLVDKIFKGNPAGTIPVVSSESFLQINYKEAQRLGLTIPEGLLSRADKVIR